MCSQKMVKYYLTKYFEKMDWRIVHIYIQLITFIICHAYLIIWDSKKSHFGILTIISPKMVKFVVGIDEANDSRPVDPTNWGRAKLWVEIGYHVNVHRFDPSLLRAYEALVDYEILILGNEDILFYYRIYDNYKYDWVVLGTQK